MGSPATESTTQVDTRDRYVEAAGRIRSELMRLESEASDIKNLRSVNLLVFDAYEIEATQARLEADYFSRGTLVDESYDWPIMPSDAVMRLRHAGIFTPPTGSTE